MKKVFSKDETAHIWAQRSQSEGRTSSSNLFFENETIYSYGKHWPLAAFIDRKGKETIVLTNSGSYSVTTASQQAIVNRAVSHYKQFAVPNITADMSRFTHKENYQHLKTTAIDTFKKSLTARSNKDHLLMVAYNIAEQANEYSKLFALRFKPIVLQEIDQDKALVELKAARKKVNEAKKARQIARDIELAEKLADWKNGDCGERVRIGLHSLSTIHLRLNGDNVETTGGVNFPASHCALLWRQVKKCVENGESWRANGHTISLGYYNVNSISSKGLLVAGCHRVQLEQMTEIAAKLELPCVSINNK